jgi:hypothetical protein
MSYFIARFVELCQQLKMHTLTVSTDGTRFFSRIPGSLEQQELIATIVCKNRYHDYEHRGKNNHEKQDIPEMH